MIAKFASRIVAVIVAIILLAVAGTLYAATTNGLPCSNPHLATQQEADAASGGGIVAGVTYVCPSDASLGISNLVGAAKEYLNSVPKKCVGSCAAPPDSAHIAKLNDTFAVCAANFIKAYTQKYGAIYISSAYRDGPSGENARAGGAPNSNHTKGLAMDMSPANGDFQTMWKFASQNPQFGVCFPYLGSDRPHMGLAGTGTGEAAKCAAQGVTKQCTGSPNFTPSAVTSSGPTTSYDEGGALYGNTAAGPAATTPYTTLPPTPYAGAPVPTVSAPATTATTPATTATTPISSTSGTTAAPMCSPQFSCSNNVMYYQTTSCTTQVYQTCTSGCNGNSCANITPTATSSTLVSTPNTVQASSTQDLLDAFSDPVSLSATTIGTATSIGVVLNGDTSEVTQLGTIGSSTTIDSGTIASIQPIGGQETFTSSDLSNTSVSANTSVQASSGVFKILSDLRNALVWAINFLNPFSGTK